MQMQEIGIFHLKDLQERHFSLQTIGTGGQFLLSGIDNIQETHRSPEEFYEIISRKEIEWQERKRSRVHRTTDEG